jgi:hypothetical protein
MSTKKDEVFDVEQAIVSTTAIANQTAWGLDTNWMSNELVPKKNRWDICLPESLLINWYMPSGKS